jgi:hypothetical protein
VARESERAFVISRTSPFVPLLVSRQSNPSFLQPPSAAPGDRREVSIDRQKSSISARSLRLSRSGTITRYTTLPKTRIPRRTRNVFAFISFQTGRRSEDFSRSNTLKRPQVADARSPSVEGRLADSIFRQRSSALVYAHAVSSNRGDSEATIVSTYSARGCFVGLLWGLAVPCLFFAISFGILGIPHTKYPQDHIAGGIVIGIVGLFTFCLSLGLSTYRVQLQKGVLSQRGVFSPSRQIVLAEAEEVLLQKSFGQSRRLEYITVRQHGKAIRIVDSFRDYERLRDGILSQVPGPVIDDRRT